MDIKNISIKKLKDAEYNPRISLKPGDEEFEKLKRSIEEFGLVQPIIVNKDMTVVGGHQRLAVLRDLGRDLVTCVVIDVDKTREKALNIALNKISGDWDMPKLKDLLLDIDTGEIDVLLTGFSEKELEKLMTQAPPEVKDVDIDISTIKEIAKCPHCGGVLE